MSDRSNRSVTIGTNNQGVIVTGDRATVTTMITVPLPPPETVDVKAELAALRDQLAALNIPEKKRFDHAAEEAADETAKPAPDKQEAADSIGRMVKYATAADDFSAHAEKLLPRIAALASWLGTAGRALLGIAV